MRQEVKQIYFSKSQNKTAPWNWYLNENLEDFIYYDGQGVKTVV